MKNTAIPKNEHLLGMNSNLMVMDEQAGWLTDYDWMQEAAHKEFAESLKQKARQSSVNKEVIMSTDTIKTEAVKETESAPKISMGSEVHTETTPTNEALPLPPGFFSPLNTGVGSSENKKQLRAKRKRHRQARVKQRQLMKARGKK